MNFNLCIPPGCELPCSDSFALLFKINYCSVLVSVPLEDELEATFPSSSSSVLIFKVAKSVPELILGASLARKVAIHNCYLLFDFFHVGSTFAHSNLYPLQRCLTFSILLCTVPH